VRKKKKWADGIDRRVGRRIGLRGEKRKRGGRGCLGLMVGMGEGLVFFIFFSFYFFSTFLLKIFSSFSKRTFKPHNQTKAHAFNMMHNHLVSSKLINYYFIY
jgi:hypothetical protein